MPAIATVQVFDFEALSGDPVNANPANVAGALIIATLNYNQVNSVSPQANLQAVRVQTLTDTTGRWQLNLVPNGNINPANTLWTIQTPTQNYQISVPSSGPVQSSSIKVNAPSTLAGAGGTVTGPLTVTGLLTAQAGETVSGGQLQAQAGATVAGGLTVSSGGATVAGGATVNGAVLTANAGLTVAGAVSLPAGSVGVAALSGILSIANGGTGSGTQNFVDLSTAQTVAGAKTFSALLTAAAHILATGATPTLGALQTNVASQSIVGNDVRGAVSFTTTGAAGPASGAAVAIVTFASAYATTPIIVVTGAGNHATPFTIANPSTTGFTIINAFSSALPPSYSDVVNYVVIG